MKKLALVLLAATLLAVSAVPALAHDWQYRRHDPYGNPDGNHGWRHRRDNWQFIIPLPIPVPIIPYSQPPCRLVWVQGQWIWNGYQWVWQAGYWQTVCY